MVADIADGSAMCKQVDGPQVLSCLGNEAGDVVVELQRSIREAQARTEIGELGGGKVQGAGKLPRSRRDPVGSPGDGGRATLEAM